jgi:methyl-coenzyme M reductase beta subunit
MFSVEKTSALVGSVFGSMPEFKEPIKAVAGAL